MGKIFLASGSPRRKELLSHIVPKFEVLVPDFEESVGIGENPKDYAERMSEGKAKAFWEQFADQVLIGDTFITSDTVVCLEGEIFGKPKDRDDAKRVIMRLSGNSHEVITSVTIGTLIEKKPKYETFSITTQVFFREIYPDELNDYLDSDEPWDKAGAYGIQGKASTFVSRIHGSYHSVVGLPVSDLAEKLRDNITKI